MTSALENLDRYVPHLTDVTTHAMGNLHRHFFGVHYYQTFTWWKGEGEPARGPVRSVHSVARGDWSLSLDATAEFAPTVEAWSREHGAEVDSKFDAMLAILRAAYPDSGGRDFRILVSPQRRPIDVMWTHWAISGRRLELTYAFPLSDASGADASPMGAFATLAHEFAHSYFWFHPQRMPNDFSGEVVAYTTDHCVSAALFSQEYDWVEPGFRDFAKTVSGLGPDQIWMRYHERYPDTYLAFFAAVNELLRVQVQAGKDVNRTMGAYCRAMPMSGRDFTRPR
ncbi:MAG TPA: hypothetical protein VH301_01575 [Usitatibacter sp.]|nr:hypothetical protein [Usitatibacter sp.]